MENERMSVEQQLLLLEAISQGKIKRVVGMDIAYTLSATEAVTSMTIHTPGHVSITYNIEGAVFTLDFKYVKDEVIIEVPGLADYLSFKGNVQVIRALDYLMSSAYHKTRSINTLIRYIENVPTFDITAPDQIEVNKSQAWEVLKETLLENPETAPCGVVKVGTAIILSDSYINTGASMILDTKTGDATFHFGEDECQTVNISNIEHFKNYMKQCFL